MKKILSLALVIAMMLTLAAPGFAGAAKADDEAGADKADKAAYAAFKGVEITANNSVKGFDGFTFHADNKILNAWYVEFAEVAAEAGDADIAEAETADIAEDADTEEEVAVVRGTLPVAYKIGSDYFIAELEIEGPGIYIIGDSKGKNGLNAVKIGAFVEYIPEEPEEEPGESGDPGDTEEEPTDPAEPTDPTDPEEPAEPTDPTDPEEPAEPTDPEDPADPTEPESGLEDPEGDPESPGEPVNNECEKKPELKKESGHAGSANNGPAKGGFKPYQKPVADPALEPDADAQTDPEEEPVAEPLPKTRARSRHMKLMAYMKAIHRARR